MSEEVAFDVGSVDLSRVVADRDAIRAVNPHRHEFEMLTAVVLMDTVRKVAVGYKDVSADDFWTRGHFPGVPVMPGVLQIEAAAQLCNYYTHTQKVVDEGVLMALGGVEEARFYRPVKPGDRLVLVGVGLRMNRRMTKSRVTGYVKGERVFETVVIGVPIGRLEDLKGA